MATEGQEPNPSQGEEAVPPEAFSMVWVKMEVEDEGIVEEHDGAAADDDDDYTYPQNSDRNQYIEGNSTLNPDGDEEKKPFQVNFSENLKKGPVKRCRKKATAPNRRSSVDPELKKFTCQYCDYRAMHKNALKYHTMKHTNEAPIACKFCSYTTKYPNSMKQHVLGQHTDKDDPVLLALPIYKCNLCEYNTRFKWNLAVHRRKHAVEKSFQCDMCGFASAHRHSFIKHVRRHAPKESAMYQCDKCPFKTKYEGHISRHLAIIHKEVSDKATKCDYCEFSTRVKWRMNQHRKNSRQQTPVPCGGCDFSSEYLCEIKLHRKKHTFSKETLKDLKQNCQIYPPKIKLKAPKPETSLNSASSAININNSVLQVPQALPRNITSGAFHTNQNNEVSQQDENSKVNLPENPINTPDDKFYILDKVVEEVDWRKIEVLEVPGVEKSFSCKNCVYSAKYKASVQRHFQRLHTSKDVRPYKCLKCGFTTKTKDQISLHIKRSKSEMVLICHLCDFLSYFKCQYAIHQKVHYPLKCNLCDYCCKQNYTLQEHFRTAHLGQSFQCKYCDYVATGKSNLLTHEIKHTCQSQFWCHLCDYKTVRRRLLQIHLQKNHPDQRIQPKIIDDEKIASLKTDEVSLNQQSIEHLVKNVKEQIKKFGDKLVNETNIANEGSSTNVDVNNSLTSEPATQNIESVSVKIERDAFQNNFEREDFQNNICGANKPQTESRLNDAQVNTQPPVFPQPHQSDFQMRYAESLNQTYYENALRYAGSQHPNYFERW